MSSYNRVVVMGNLTRTPELRQIPSGKSVAELSLALNERYKDASGLYVESTCFVDIVVWGRQAETCSEYLDKGSPVLIEGKLQLDRWESSDGNKRSKLRVRADRVQFLPRSGKRQDIGNTRESNSTEGTPVPHEMADVPF